MQEKSSQILSYVKEALVGHKQFISLLCVLVLVAVIPFTVIALQTGYQKSQHAQTSQPTVQSIRNYYYPDRAFKPACAWQGPGYARCLSEVVVDSSGNPWNVSSPTDLLPKTAANGQALNTASTPASSLDQYATTRLHTAYQLPCTPGGPVQTNCQASTFGPSTVAIVMGGDDPTVEQDLGTYSQQFNIPSCTKANGCLQVVNQTGGSQLPPADQNTIIETSMDVQTVHAICQTCKIVLVEANSMTMDNISAAVNYAASLHPAAVSISLGGPEDSSLSSIDNLFHHPGVAIVVANGDWCVNDTCPGQSGIPPNSGANYPSTSNGVIAVAGTTLQLNSDNSYASESVWPQSGGGCSKLFSAGSWQTGVSTWSQIGCGSKRLSTDVAAVGDPKTGVAVYHGGTWNQVGGTSLAAPVIAGVIGLTGKGIDPSVPYANPGGFHDVTSGSNGSCGTILCQAGVGFDGASGLGSPKGLSGFGGVSTSTTPTNTPTPTTHASPTPTGIHTSPSPTPTGVHATPTTNPDNPTITQVTTGSATYTLNVTLTGVGSNPVTTAVVGTADFYSVSDGSLVYSTPGSVVWKNGVYTATITLDDQALNKIKDAEYILKIKVDGYLRKQATQIVQVGHGVNQTINVTLTAGDATGDNVVDLQDFTLLEQCIGKKSSSGTIVCVDIGKHINADLNEDQNVDILDYNILLSTFSQQEGE